MSDKERALLWKVFQQADVLTRLMDQHSLTSARGGSYRGDPAIVKEAARLGTAVETVFEYKRQNSKEPGQS